MACKVNLRSTHIAKAPDELGLVFRHDTSLLQFGFKFSHARAEGLIPLPTCGDILHGGGYAQDAPIGIFEQYDVELD